MNGSTIARDAASSLFPDAEEVVFSRSSSVGEQIYVGSRKGKTGVLTVTVNPNGAKAAVEWRSKFATDYRVFRVEDLPAKELR